MEDSVDAKQDDSDAFYDPHCEPCHDNKGSYVDVYGYCHECYKFFCPACHRKHSKRKTTKTHAIRNGAEMPISIAAKPPRYDACNIHPGMLKDYFCERHKCLICSSCGSSCHKDCCVSTVEDVCKTIQSSDFQALDAKINDYHRDLKSFESLIYTHVNRLQEEREDMVLRIQSLYEESVSKLERKYSEAKEEIEKAYSSKFKLMVQHQKTINKLLSETDVSLTQSRQLCGSPLDAKAFLRSQDLINNINLSSRQAQELQKLISFVSIRFKPEEYFDGLLSSQVKFGSLTVDESVSVSQLHFSKISPFTFSQAKYSDTAKGITQTRNDDTLQEKETKRRKQAEKGEMPEEHIAVKKLATNLQQTKGAVHLRRKQTQKGETTAESTAVQKLDTEVLQDDEESIQDLTITSQNPATDNIHMKAYRRSSHSVALHDDQYVCNISGMAVTEDGRLLLVDKANRKIKMFSPTVLSAIPFKSRDMKYLGCIKLQEKPLDIALLNNHEAVVTTDDKSLAVLGTDGGVFCQELYLKFKLSLGFNVRGVARFKDKIVITCPDEAYCVKQIDTAGNEFWSVSTHGSSVISKPSYVCSVTDGASSHILIQDQHSLVLLEGETGQVIAMRRSKYKGIGGFAAGSDGNIYHCYNESKEICLLHGCLSDERTLLTYRTTLPTEPNCMVYDRLADKLVVAFQCIDKVDFFDLSVPSDTNEMERAVTCKMKAAKLKLDFALENIKLTLFDSTITFFRRMASYVAFHGEVPARLCFYDVNLSDISGMAETKDGFRIYIDKESATVNVYRPSVFISYELKGRLLWCLKLPAKPWDIDVIDNHEAVVTTDENSLFILDITKEHICVKERVMLPFSVKGIAKYTENTFAVTCPDECPACIKLIDKTGNVYWSSSSKQLFTYPRYVTCNRREVIVTDQNEWITKLDGRTGKIKARKEMKNKGPTCVNCRSNGNIIVVNSKSGEVAVISEDLSKEKILLKYVHEAQAIGKRFSETVLILSYRNKKFVDVYDVHNRYFLLAAVLIALCFIVDLFV